MNKSLLFGVLAMVLSVSVVSQVESAERQPKMSAALEKLEAAKKNLLEASDDKGGHKLKAIKLIDSAIDEVKAGMKYDNRHHDDDRKHK